MSESTIKNELVHAAKLDNKQRGELAELAFMRKAAALGFAVAKPWGDSDRYDVIVRTGGVFWRVQIKSVWAIRPTRNYYRIKTTGGRTSRYSPAEIDFLAAYIFPEDTWYLFPAALVENKFGICIRARCVKSPFEPYREAWDLMRPPEYEAAATTPVAAAATADPT